MIWILLPFNKTGSLINAVRQKNAVAIYYYALRDWNKETYIKILVRVSVNH